MRNVRRCISLTLAGWPLPLCSNLVSCRGRDNTSQGGSISTPQYSAPLSQTQRECTCLEVRLWHKACREPDVSEARFRIDASASIHWYLTKTRYDLNRKRKYAWSSLPCLNMILMSKKKVMRRGCCVNECERGHEIATATYYSGNILLKQVSLHNLWLNIQLGVFF